MGLEYANYIYYGRGKTQKYSSLLENLDYLFINITARSTLAQSGCSASGHINGSSRSV